MPDVLIVGDTVRSPELRHEVPLSVPDPFLYAERNGSRYVMVGSLEIPRIEALHKYEVVAPEELGLDELLRQGLPREEVTLELLARACRRFGIDDAVVPKTFPLEVADHLRANGVNVRADRGFFDERRRSKNEAEIAGIRKAQRAAEAGMAAARDMLRRAEHDGAGSGLVLDGEPLTSERIKRAIEDAFGEHDCTGEDFIVSHGAQAAIGHEAGFGQILAGETIVIDLWPRDRESACYSDMTRTFVVGDIPDEVAEWQRLVKEALDRALDDTKPGALGSDIYRGTCDLFHEHGYPTQLSKEPGTQLHDGFFHGLGHGVGLEVHEEPTLGIATSKPLVPGDVITIEPGLYRSGYGGCRLEDIVLVTENGCENLTNFPYDLTP